MYSVMLKITILFLTENYQELNLTLHKSQTIQTFIKKKKLNLTNADNLNKDMQYVVA